MPDVGRKGSGKHTQSVVFYKAAGWTEASSRVWCKAHDYKTDGLDETDNLYRWRQVDPESSKFRYRNDVIEKKGEDPSIMFVLGFPHGTSQSAVKRHIAFVRACYAMRKFDIALKAGLERSSA